MPIQPYDPIRKQLTFRGATTFPLDILDRADDIEILDLSHGSLTSLPSEFSRLQQLKILFLSDNPFTEVPAVLAHCPNLTILGMKGCQIDYIAEDVLPTSLRWLILTDNKLTALPSSIGQLTQLQKLALAGNQLQTLPMELNNCQHLELIRLGANQFTTLPDWLLTLPRLAWYGGIGQAPQHTLNEIPFAAITLGDVIGSSPSSEVYQAALSQTGQPVAVKLYHRHLTSDGWPEDDMRACIAAGTQPNLIPVLGKISQHPAGKHGLVLQLIPDTFHSLGLPPNFNSITRDTFAPNTNFSLSFIISVLKGVASAGAHLHQQGIMHGDLYAHNILANAAGDCYLGDFGAASFYGKSSSTIFEQVEVRAFGYLLEDLLAHCNGSSPELLKLQQACLATTVAARPLFSEIYGLLQNRG